MKHEPHSWRPLTKRISIPYCKKCGLVKLRNDRTEDAVRLGCNYDESLSYQTKWGKT